MADFMFPPNARVSNLQWEMISNAAGARSIFTGAYRSVDRTGDHWRYRVMTEAASDSETYSSRAALKAFRALLRGSVNKAWCNDPAYRKRGSFASSELIANNMFADGITGWTVGSTNLTLTVADRILRATRGNVSSHHTIRASVGSVVQWAPYAFRVATVSGRGTMEYRLVLGTTAGGSEIAADAAFYTTQGLRTIAAVVPSTTLHAAIQDGLSGRKPGDYTDITYSSLARCCYVDVGVNGFQRSSEIDNAYWTKFDSTVTANTTSYDGAAVADRVVENSANSTHGFYRDVTKAASALEYCLAVAVRAGNNAGQRNRFRLRMGDASSTDYVEASFNLGTVTSAVAAAGTGANARAYIAPLDVLSEWYYCAVVGRLDTETTARCTLFLEDATGAISYTGDNTSNLLVSDMTVGQSGSPIQLVRTGVNTSDGASPTFFAVLKGLPESVNGLFLPGDRIEIVTSTGSEVKTVVAPVNSDAAGLGFVKWSPPLKGTVLANAPVIVHNPLGRFLLPDQSGGWTDSPGGFSDIEFVLEEALTDDQ